MRYGGGKGRLGDRGLLGGDLGRCHSLLLRPLVRVWG